MSRFLVVYYSYTGTSRQVVQALCELRSWPHVEVADAVPRSGWSGTMRCMLDSILRRCPDIVVKKINMRDYDAVVLVSPIWAYALAGPMRTFIAQYRATLPDVAVISVMGSRGASNAVAEIERTLGRAPMMSTALTAHEVETGVFAARLDAFSQALQGAKDSQLVNRPVVSARVAG